MKLPSFDYAAPESVEQAVALLAGSDGDAKPISGGQSLMPILAFRLAAPRLLVDLRRIPGLGRIDITPAGLRIGARVRWCDILDDARLATAQPLLQHATSHVAHYQIRTRGTVGGSLVHADPAAEMPGVAVACDGVLVLVGPGGERRVSAGEFFLGPMATALAPDELLVAIELPTWSPTRRWGFAELSRRRGDFAIAGVFAHYEEALGSARDVHVAVIGVGSHARRLTPVEAVLEGRPIDDDAVRDASAVASGTVDAQDDLHAGADYRRSLVGTLLERVLRDCTTSRLREAA